MRLAIEMFLVALAAFGATLGPLFEGGLNAPEYVAAGVAAVTAALAMLRQQPKK